jgi:excisionase family DNA binding protein
MSRVWTSIFSERIISRKIRGLRVDKPYLTVEDVAELLQVSVETVRGYINRKKNKLPAFKVGREWRVRKTDLDRWVEENMNIREDDNA